jgi:hypothetical protein
VFSDKLVYELVTKPTGFWNKFWRQKGILQNRLLGRMRCLEALAPL